MQTESLELLIKRVKSNNQTIEENCIRIVRNRNELFYILKRLINNAIFIKNKIYLLTNCYIQSSFFFLKKEFSCCMVTLHLGGWWFSIVIPSAGWSTLWCSSGRPICLFQFSEYVYFIVSFSFSSTSPRSILHFLQISN